jgi:hypothetical protein
LQGAETRLLSGEAELTERLSEMKERLDLLTAENTVLVEQADMVRLVCRPHVNGS